MKKQLRFLFFLFSLSFAAAYVQASHLVGAEISYAPVNGATDYRVEVVVYRDCSGLPASATIPVEVTSSCSALPVTVYAQQTAPGVIIPLGCAAASTLCNGGTAAGIEKITYVTTVQVSGNCQDWTFSYTECCRSTATNMANPGSEALYVYAVLKNPLAAFNRSVAFTQAPRFMLFNGQTNILNNGAVDSDGDSVVCTLADAKSSAAASVSYAAGFSGASPVASQPAMSAEPLTGQVSVTPVSLQTNVVAYRYDEYRNGALIGTTVRDVLVSVVNTSNTLPTLSGVNGTSGFALQACTGDTVSFSLYSGDANPSDPVSIEVSTAGAGSTATVLHGTFASPSGAVSDSVRIYLVADASMVGNGPHYIYVTVRDGACPNEGVQTYVVDLSVNSCNAPPSCAAYFASSTAGLSASFIDLSSGISPSTTFSWTFGDGTSSNVRFPQHTYSTPGMYTVCLTISDNNCSNQYCAMVLADTNTVNPGPCQANFVTLQAAPYSVLIVDLSTGSNLNYLWDFGDGTTSTQQYPSHYYSTTGSYVLCLTVNDGLLGCSSTFCDTLTVDSTGNVLRSTMTGFSVNVVSPGMLTGTSSTEVPEQTALYPNPAIDRLIVSRSQQSVAGYRILDLRGAVVLSGILVEANTAIPVTSLSNGVYVLETIVSGRPASYARFMKQ